MVTKSSFRPIIVLLTIAAAAGGPGPLNMAREPMPLELIRPSADGTHFVCAPCGRTMVIWGVNYDHDDSGQLLEDYWHEAWETVVEDFQEITLLLIGHFGKSPVVDDDQICFGNGFHPF